MMVAPESVLMSAANDCQEVGAKCQEVGGGGCAEGGACAAIYAKRRSAGPIWRRMFWRWRATRACTSSRSRLPPPVVGLAVWDTQPATAQLRYRQAIACR